MRIEDVGSYNDVVSEEKISQIELSLTRPILRNMNEMKHSIYRI